MPTSLGLVGITNKGNYDAQTPYVKGNFVYHNGSSWLLIANTATGVEPNENNSTTWQYLAKGFNVLPFQGATASTDGTGGTVPQPHAGDEGKVLKGDGSWGAYLPLSGGALTGALEVVNVNVNGCVATGTKSHAEGSSTTASGDYSHAEGEATVASGYGSHSEGSGHPYLEGMMLIASGKYSHAEGYGTKAKNQYSHAEGYQTVANSDDAHAEGYQTTASGYYSHAEGEGTCTDNQSSHSEGYQTRALGYYSHAEGNATTANGENSHSEGQSTIIVNSMSASYCAGSHAEGGYTTVTQNFAHAEGYYTCAAASYQHVSGKYNVANSTQANRFIVGKGSSNSARANSFRVNDSGVYGAGAYNSSGADYAELFEWADGNKNNEDRAGKFVTLDGDKIKFAKPNDDYILGVVSGYPSVVGDVFDDQWQGMLMTDIFGRPIYEKVEVDAEYREHENPETGKIEKVEIYPAHTETIQKVNPNYDNTTEYKPRTERPEWDAVGVLGKLVCIDDGTCEINGYAKVNEDSIATASDERTKFRVMKRLDESHIQIFIM